MRQEVRSRWQPRWPAPPPDLRPASGVVDVWAADLAAAGAAERALLSDDERARAGQFADPAVSARWAAARGILRALLARALDADPRALRFAAGPHGKPALVAPAAPGERGPRMSGESAPVKPAAFGDAAAPGGPAAPGGAAAPGGTVAPGGASALSARLRFNVSHSGALALYALALDREVGVDVELPRRRAVDMVAIARRTFGDAEAERLAALDPQRRQREFLRAWTRWEATVKCRGLGIGAAESQPPDGPQPWLRELDPGPPAVAALAVEGGPCEVRCWRWGGAAT